jgi:hypothetical protein
MNIFCDLMVVQNKSIRRSHDAVIRVYDEAGNVIETHEHKGKFKEPQILGNTDPAVKVKQLSASAANTLADLGITTR